MTHPELDEADWPERIKRMPKYKGLPRLYTAIEVDGVVDFATTDMARWLRCIAERRCGVCGDVIHTRRFWMIGGPESVGHHAFFDPPMHEECAAWSFDNCPFINGSINYQSAERVATKDARLEAAGGVKVADQDVADAPIMYLCSATRHTGPHRSGQSGFCWAAAEARADFRIDRERVRRREPS